MFDGKFLESTKKIIEITFPSTIDPFGIHGTRYMNQIAYRLKTGFYQLPGKNQDTIHAIFPEADGDRFITFEEMEQVLDFLMMDKSEKNLIEEFETASSDGDSEDHCDNDDYRWENYYDGYDQYDNLQAEFLEEDFGVGETYPGDESSEDEHHPGDDDTHTYLGY